MLNSIRGIITEKLDGSVFIACGGLEWDISVPATDINRLPSIGEEGKIYTWLYHKEDQMKLYGFASDRSRATFLELLKVEGIGPKAAIKILSGITQEELEKALDSDDLARLEAVPGLGKKTAQKMILALKGKLKISAAATASPYGELAQALVEMGYDKHAAIEALSQAEKEIEPGVTGNEKENLLFKKAIVILSGAS